MKIEILNINNINITFYIGRNSQENFDIIDQADCDDLWFHLNDLPSCHVVASIPSNVKDKKLINKIIKQGAVLCKKYSKYSSTKNLNIVFTKIKNISKTNIIGTVNTSNTKNILI